ncbi:MAG: radical SAM protein [Phycisphaerales bacterium]|nr:MAG: radical SAM protein [Phycisphaerales bacterium]
MKPELISSTLKQMVKHRHLRKLLAKRIDDYIRKSIVNNESQDLKEVQIRRYQFLSAMLHCMIRNMDKGYVSGRIIERIVEVFVQNNLIRGDGGYIRAVEKYQEKYGEPPPTFIVFSPTQRCNLRCTGCYAASGVDTPATVPFQFVERVVAEVHDIFGGRFITISGGEPFMYKSDGKTLLDVFEKYTDMFFMVYTNGTVINQDIVRRLAETANVTPAVSVEGFEKETDLRRGPGAFKKILATLDRLRNAGVPFGISATATSRNMDALLSDEFYEFYFQKQGACYMWQFQMMPIGRGKDELDLMVNPENRLKLFRKWEQMLVEKKYCLADFWNSGVLARGCIAYGRSGGYAYVDWHGNVTPCAFIPYYVDNIYDLYERGKTLADAMFSDFMIKGRKWQREYGLDDCKRPKNWLMPCSIRDHYEIFRKAVLPENARPEDKNAGEALKSEEYFDLLKSYDKELQGLTERIWENEYLSV